MQHSSQNVTGMERKLSIAGGLGLLACGLRHGGVGGLLALAAGGMALYRGLTGHCELKERLCERHSGDDIARSEEHTSELQSRPHLVCRLLLEKKKKKKKIRLSD